MHQLARQSICLFFMLGLTLSACSSGGSSTDLTPANTDSNNPLVTGDSGIEDNNDFDLPIFTYISTFDNNPTAGDRITLEAGTAYRSDDFIYQWTQLEGPVQLEINELDGNKATIDLPQSATAQVFVISLTVSDENGDTGSDTISIDVAPSINCPQCKVDQNNLVSQSKKYYTGQGQVAVIDDSKVVLADQQLNQLKTFDLETGSVVSTVQLNGAPDHLYYQRETQSVYTSLIGATAITRYNFNTTALETFPVSAIIVSITGGDGRVHYVTGKDFTDYSLYSIDSMGAETNHSILPANTIAFNAARNELVSANSEGSFQTGEVARYSIDDSGQLNLIQKADRDIVPSANNIVFSKDGSRTIFSQTRFYSGEEGVINDIPSDNLNASDGAWLSDQGALWVALSANEKYLALITYEYLRIYDATTKVKLVELKLPSDCQNSNGVPKQTGFTANSQYVYVKLTCFTDTTVDNKNAYLFYLPMPEL